MDAKDIFGITGICKDSPSRPGWRGSGDGEAVRDREFPQMGKGVVGGILVGYIGLGILKKMAYSIYSIYIYI